MRTVGSTVDRYRLVAQVGAGGMGEVWRALDERLGREVALKFLPASCSGDETLRARLTAEARVLAQISHPRIVALYELEEAEGEPYLVLEWIGGESLACLLSRGPLPLRMTLAVASEIAEALAAAHERGVVHGDLKPANILIATAGGVKLLDFGLARLLSAAWPELHDFAGTAGYLAPERARGEPPTAASDLFALGVVLFEMLAGRRPFARSEPAKELVAIAHAEPPELASVCEEAPLGLAALLGRLLAKQPSARPPNAAAVVVELAHLVGDTRPESLLAPGSTGGGFRGLLPYSEGDRAAFLGRDADIATIVARLLEPDFRLGILHGDSGSGKTSLLRAGLVPRLRERGFLPLVCRSRDPLAALVAEGHRQGGVAPHPGEPLLDWLGRLAREMDAPLLLAFDQFEELFVHLPEEAARAPFLELLAACEREPSVPVRLLLVIRSDFLHRVADDLDGRVAEPLAAARRIHLAVFDERQAAEIVDRSARAAGLPFEEGLAGRIAEDLSDSGRVLPSELQIVGAQMQRRRIFSLADYARAGGKEQLVHRYLDEVVEATGDAEGARLLLRALVSSEGTRQALTADELAARVPRSREVVARLRSTFVGARLVRELHDEEPPRFELQHEYLIAAIERSSGVLLDPRERAHRLLRQHAAAFAVDRQARVPLVQLATIRRFADPSRRKEQRELLQRSLRRGLLRAAGAVLLTCGAVTAVAAAAAVREEWQGARLRDGHTAAVHATAFTPDARLLVSGSEDGKVALWDFAERRQVAELADLGSWVTTLAISPDGRWLAYGGSGGRLVVREIASRRVVATVERLDQNLAGLTFSPDSSLLAGADRSSILVWEARSWRELRRFPGGFSGHGGLTFSRDGALLLRPDLSGWEVASGRPVSATPGRPWAGNWAAISPDGRESISVDTAGAVRFVEMARRTVLAAAHPHRDHGRAAAYSPDGRFAVTGAEDIVLWDARSHDLVARLEYPSIVWHLGFSPDGRFLVSSHGDGSIVLWALSTRERVAILGGHAGPVRSVAFTRDGSHLATGSEDRSVIVWDIARRREDAVLLGHETRVNAVAFGPSASTLASCDQSGEVRLWEIAAKRSTWRRAGEANAYAVAFSGDGRSVAASSGVWQTETGRPIRGNLAFPGNGSTYGLVFARDDRWLAAVTDGSKVVRFAAGEFALVDELLVSPAAPIVAVDLSPDGRRLATGGDDGVVRLFEAEPLRELGEIGRHAARVKSVAFAPDGRRIATASDDRTVALWDVDGRRKIAEIGTHTAPVLALAFSPDGDLLAVGGHDGSVRLFARSSWLWGWRLNGDEAR